MKKAIRALLSCTLSVSMCVALMPATLAFAQDNQAVSSVSQNNGAQLDSIINNEEDDESNFINLNNEENSINQIDEPVADEPAADEADSVVKSDSESNEVVEGEGDAIDNPEEEPFSPTLSYRAHVKNYGWLDWVGDRETAGTTGKNLRAEALQITLSGVEGGIKYQAHVMNIGWQDWVESAADKEASAVAGTTGKGLQLEAIKIELTGKAANQYDIYYRVHVKNIGWMNWAKNGEAAGSVGRNLQAEAVQITLVAKDGGQAPSGSGLALSKGTGDGSINYQVHSANYGWKSYVSDGSVGGTVGESLRAEAIRINTDNIENLGVTYRTHVSNFGWTDWSADGAASGTTGKSLQMEALAIKLTGEAAENYDVYYRVHVANIGWLGWAKNGEKAGTTGAGVQVEAVRIKLVEKGTNVSSGSSVAYLSPSTISSYLTVNALSGSTWVSGNSGSVVGTTGQSCPIYGISATLSAPISGSINYYVSDGGAWTNTVSNGAQTGYFDFSRKVQAVSFYLTGDMANYFDLYYRVHVANIGWLGWTSNTSPAGTSRGLQVEAVQVQLVIKGCPAPGSTDMSFVRYSTNPKLEVYLSQIISSRGTDLRSLFNYVVSYPYRSGSLYPSGNWSESFAIEMYERGSGNCYRYAALFCELAKAVGYNARVVSGAVPSRSGGTTPHGWVEVIIGGTTYVCDPDLAHELPGYNWYMVTYAGAPCTYYR